MTWARALDAAAVGMALGLLLAYLVALAVVKWREWRLFR